MPTDDDYKSPEDPQRAYFLLGFLNTAKDYSQTSSLSAAFLRELAAMNSRQAARDTKEAAAAKAKAAHEAEPHSSARAGRARV